MRRGVADLDGTGDVVAGIVVMRQGENALDVIERVKAKLQGDRARAARRASRSSPTYDRSDLIQRSIDTLKHTLIEEMIIVSLVILLFLWHIPSAIIPIVTIPVAVLLAFIPMQLMGVTLEHHVARRHRDRDRRAGGRRDRRGRERHKKLEHWERTGGRATTTASSSTR